MDVWCCDRPMLELINSVATYLPDLKVAELIDPVSVLNNIRAIPFTAVTRFRMLFSLGIPRLIIESDSL